MSYTFFLKYQGITWHDAVQPGSGQEKVQARYLFLQFCRGLSDKTAQRFFRLILQAPVYRRCLRVTSGDPHSHYPVRGIYLLLILQI